MENHKFLGGVVGVRPAILILVLFAAVDSAPQAIPSVNVNRVNDNLVSFDTVAPHSPSAPTMASAQETYGKLPMYFEANRGQTNQRVKFLSHGTSHTLFLTSTEAVLVLTKREQIARDKRENRGKAGGTVLRMAFLRANPHPLVVGSEELPGKVNYFIGNDPNQWRTDVPTYAQVQYQDIYRGIDLTYYGNQRQLECDFIVRPGADPRRIVLGFQGADKLEVDAQGDLVLHTALGPIRQQRPFIYQEVDGVRREISGSYVLEGKNRVGFHVAAYNTSRPLVIDPVLFYSTYLGGGGGGGYFPSAKAIAVDAAGNAYIAGSTRSSNFPTTAGAFKTTGPSGSQDAYVTKLNPTGSGLVYSTYLGGSAEDDGVGVALDSLGNSYVTGVTFSTDFPTLAAFQIAFGGGSADAFITKLNPTGSGLVYSTYLGGSGDDFGQGIALDALGNTYVTGFTTSTNFPTTPGSFQTAPGGAGIAAEAFVTKLNPGGTGLVYSTYLGQSAFGGVGYSLGNGIAVDAGGDAYIAGQVLGPNFPTTPGAFQTTFCCDGGFDGFVTKVNPLGTGLVYSTYLGGPSVATGIAADALSNAYIAGFTNSPIFPTTPGAFQAAKPSAGADFDGFVTKMNPLGTGLVYSTFLGGSGNDYGSGIALDALGNTYVTGRTASTDFPTTTGAPQTSFGGGSNDAFVTKVNPLGTGLVYSTYLGGSGDDQGNGIALDALPTPNAYVSGVTGSTDFPTTAGAFQTTFGGGTFDAFVTKITDIVIPPGPTVGKVTGGGTINVSGGIANFGFIVQAQSSTGPISGDLQYVNHASGANVHSVTFTTLVISGNTATFSGTCTNNGVPCTFSVMVQDNGEPGTNDVFTISINGGPPEGGTLRSGNIQIHKQ